MLGGTNKGTGSLEWMVFGAIAAALALWYLGLG